MSFQVVGGLGVTYALDTSCLRAYCVQANHFHFYARTRETNLSRFMQSLLTSFTISYNRRHRTVGHVFQGRSKAFLVEDDSSVH